MIYGQTQIKLSCIDVEYIYGFVGWGAARKVDDVTA